MPRYTFIADNGDVVDLHMSMAEHSRRVKDGKIMLDDGRVATTDWSAYAFVSTVPSTASSVTPAAVMVPATS